MVLIHPALCHFNQTLSFSPKKTVIIFVVGRFLKLNERSHNHYTPYNQPLILNYL